MTTIEQDDIHARMISEAHLAFEEAFIAYAAALDSVRLYTQAEIARMKEHHDATKKRLQALRALSLAGPPPA